MTIQACFAKKVAWSDDCNRRILALLGSDGELDLAVLDVKNRVRDLPLRENDLILPISGYRLSLARPGEKRLGSNAVLRRFLTRLPIFPDDALANIRPDLQPGLRGTAVDGHGAFARDRGPGPRARKLEQKLFLPLGLGLGDPEQGLFGVFQELIGL
jgi:hypothetical protein